MNNLHPYRYIIQMDVDVPLTPSSGNAVMFDIVLQSPRGVCDSCDEDPEFQMLENWRVTVKKVKFLRERPPFLSRQPAADYCRVFLTGRGACSPLPVQADRIPLIVDHEPENPGAKPGLVCGSGP